MKRASGIGHLKPFLPGLEAVLEDPEVSELMINGPGNVWVERGGKLEPIEAPALTAAALYRAAIHIARPLGLDPATRPVLDARLEDGSRVAICTPPASPHVAMTIRRFGGRAFSADDLVGLGSPASLRVIWTHPPGQYRVVLGRTPPSGCGSSQAASRPAGAMETLTKHFESRVGASLERTGLKPSTFGLRAVGYLNPVRQLRPGRSPRLAMAYQVAVFIEACSRAMWPLFPPGATRTGILPRTERRQTDDQSNGTEHGRARARPEVTSSAGPHRAGAEHDLRAGGRRELSPTDPARRARHQLDRVRSGCVDPRTDSREPQQCRVI